MYRLLAALTAVFPAIVACTAGAAPSAPLASGDPAALHISADQLKFSTVSLSAPAGRPFQVVFDNRETAPHNVAIYRDASAAAAVFVGEVFTGPRAVTYDVPALDAGTYYFRCDLHPEMNGSLEAR